MGDKLAELKKSVHDLKERASKSDPDQMRAAIKDALVKSRAVGRKGENFVGGDSPEIMKGMDLNRVLVTKSADPKVIDFQQRSDDIYLLAKIMGVNPRSTKLYAQFKDSELRKAMDTATGGEGAEWIPTGFSADLIDMVRLELKVASLHDHINMPTDPYKLPVVGADATGYLISENTADPESATRVKASKPTTANRTLNASKIGARVIFSQELGEDSIVPMLPFVKKNIAVALADAIEDAIINGDTSSPHMDSDVTDSTDARKAWPGYRKLADTASVEVDMSSFGTPVLRTLRADMGRFGVNPANLAWVVGVVGYNKMLGLTEVLTMDRYGQKATILSGELAKFDGIPIIVSEKQRENLNTSGEYDGTTTSKTVLQLVHRPSFIIGDRRAVTIKTDENIETDQMILVATQRLDFLDIYAASASNTIVGVGYNIA